jgi:hypothetical protein
LVEPMLWLPVQLAGVTDMKFRMTTVHNTKNLLRHVMHVRALGAFWIFRTSCMDVSRVRSEEVTCGLNDRFDMNKAENLFKIKRLINQY